MAAVSAGGGKNSLFIQHDEHNSVFAQFPNIDIISCEWRDGYLHG